MPGYVGRKARGRLRRHYVRRSIADFRARLGPGDICVDLGANFGLVSLQMARTGATVHAYEPDPDNFRVLTERTRDWPNIILHQQAVGADSGTVTLRRVSDGAGPVETRSQGSSIVLDQARMDPAKSVEVEMVSFRSVLDGIGRKVTVVKMDIEGAEVAILSRLFERGDLGGFDAMYVETHERQHPPFLPDVTRLRRLAEAIATPQIHLYWR